MMTLRKKNEVVAMSHNRFFLMFQSLDGIIFTDDS
jgi:hypothetical protein